MAESTEGCLVMILKSTWRAFNKPRLQRARHTAAFGRRKSRSESKISTVRSLKVVGSILAVEVVGSIERVNNY